ncbi:MAG: LytTR family transcriptional regulator DNA-binding domain-containing protein [Chitinophagaceae bacterium]|nr:LytTR family transcriptional regulator DNA-binding domain-containing protein [Chitinophagaceae bacterium]
MINYHYLIIDKDLHHAGRVRQLITLVRPNYLLVGVAINETEAVEYIENKRPDLIIANIHPQSERFVFNALAKTANGSFKVIFISTMNTRNMSKATRPANEDYIVKPIRSDQLGNTLSKFEKSIYLRQMSYGTAGNGEYPASLTKNLRRICINTNKGYLIKDVEHLCFVKSINNYTEYCFSESEKYIVAKTLLDSEMMLEPYGFFRIHQSFLVNLSHMELFDAEELSVLLSNGIVLPVSKRRKVVLIDCIKRIL